MAKECICSHGKEEQGGRTIMTMTEWAKREVEIACARERGDKSPDEWDYGCACYESAYKAYQSLMDDGHSGMSIGFTQNILNRLIDGKPLTPIEDTPEVWEMRADYNGKTSYRCKRMSSLFKEVYPDGRIEYQDAKRVFCVNKDNPSIAWHNGFISRLIHEKYPITMPYFSTAKPFIVYCTEGLSDPSNGDFDTIGVWYVAKPDREKDTIERFFRESPDGWEEISKQEYFERVGENNG